MEVVVYLLAVLSEHRRPEKHGRFGAPAQAALYHHSRINSLVDLRRGAGKMPCDKQKLRNMSPKKKVQMCLFVRGTPGNYYLFV